MLLDLRAKTRLLRRVLGRDQVFLHLLDLCLRNAKCAVHCGKIALHHVATRVRCRNYVDGPCERLIAVSVIGMKVTVYQIADRLGCNLLDRGQQ